ncbi:MAG: energy transducer TonB [Bacteroidota bacterium]
MQIQFSRMFFILCFCALGTALQAQTQDTLRFDKPAEFPGGEKAMYLFLGKNISYPADARQSRAQGTVIIRFDIGADGAVGNFVCLNQGKVQQNLVKEALRVLSAMPNWAPAEKDGKKVKSEMVVPVKFRLD